MSLKNLPSSSKPREKALLCGINSLSDSELLAIIIQCGTRKDDAVSLASKIIHKVGGIERLRNCSSNELCKIDGIKNAKALKILASIELGKRVDVSPTYFKKIDSLDDVYSEFGKLICNSLLEKIVLICLDSHKRVLHFDIFTSEDERNSTVDSKKLMKIALNYGSSFIILLHNHPSGLLRPSIQDIESTKIANLEFATIGIVLIDHLIVTNAGYFSIFRMK